LADFLSNIPDEYINIFCSFITQDIIPVLR